jgi:hypothetical protein
MLDALTQNDIAVNRTQTRLEKEILRIVRKHGSIDIPGLVSELSLLDIENGYFYKTALINLLSSGQLKLSLDRKVSIA